MKSALLASATALALWGAAVPASASTYEFTISGENIGTGSAVTPDVFFTVPDSDIFLSSASGEINGSDVTGFTNLSVYLGHGQPNAILGAGFTTASGVTYSFDAFEYSSTAGDAGTGTFNIAVVSSVPLPASLPMFGAALLGLGAVGYGLKLNRQLAAGGLLASKRRG